ncbi:acetoacetate decarboxylase family protein [Nocardia sp. KC 131]|uniref:acetoacetate decarboxylase family protein n=1 Tax=Nocardia arseniciresistens TaxID=3392119 RepID=UPI00398F432F
MTTHTILGKDIHMPVRIRLARTFMATYLVPADAAQRLIEYSGLGIARLPGGRAVCTLVFVDYVDGDLGPYNEFGVSFMVRHHRGTAAAKFGDLRALLTGSAGVFIHRLPVDGEFTLAAGRGIWGFPKELADFTVHRDGGARRGVLHQDGNLVVDLAVSSGVALPSRRDTSSSFDAYSHIDGVTRCTQWQMEPLDVRFRVGGADLSLGDHAWAAELGSLGLPKRALMTSVVDHLSMTFQDAALV